MNRGRLGLLLYQIPISVLLLFTYKIFELMNYDPEIAAYAQTFINLIIPGMLFFGQIDATKVFLICVGKQYQQMFIIMAIVVVQLLTCYLLIIVAGLNVVGAAIACSISYFLGFLALTFSTYA